MQIRRLIALDNHNPQEAPMKRLSVLIAMGAVALMAGGASAGTNSGHRTHLPKMPHAIVNSYGETRGPVRQNEPLADRFNHPYESESLGHQRFQNPDRVFIPGQFM
jgi:hypothetical protein